MVIEFEREHWALMKSAATLGQFAGCSQDDVPSVVLKELADNACDAGSGSVELLPDGTFVIEDDGPGIEGGGKHVAKLFSMDRPLVSTKQIRKPRRGALGMGSRVVAGAVYCWEGSLAVITKNERHVLTPQKDGTTSVISTPENHPVGTRVEINFGRLGSEDEWRGLADLTVAASRGGSDYSGRTSAFWYDSDAFHDLCQSAVVATVLGLCEEFDGCSKAKATKVIGDLGSRRANDLSREESDDLLRRLQLVAKPIKSSRLGGIGQDSCPGEYSKVSANLYIGSGRGPIAEIPFVVECWANTTTGKDQLTFLVNRSPVAGSYHIERPKAGRANVNVFGCELTHQFKVIKRPVRLLINITTPFMPTTTTGKEPDLMRLYELLYEAIEKATKKLQRADARSGKPTSQKDAIINAIPESAKLASGDGTSRFSQRQLFYKLRKILETQGREEPKWDWFTTVLGDYEATHGEIALMTRDSRGILYVPHTGAEIQLGTIEVESFKRPVWTAGIILYIEKEGILRLLRDDGFPERWDCMILTSKGYASRAVRDLIDKLPDTGEPIRCFAVTDCDGPGTVIFQSLVEATKARGARKLEIIHLGLHYEQAMGMGLRVETFDYKKSQPVAWDQSPDRKEWFRSNRIELNEMSTPQLIAWLDEQMRQHGVEKVMPPSTVLQAQMEADFSAKIRDRYAEQALRDANVEQRVQAAARAAKVRIADMSDDMAGWIVETREDDPSKLWKAAIGAKANAMADAWADA
jgi:hypothetical protein